MLDSLFEGSAFKMFLVRWFGRERPTNAGRRGRQARLAIVDAANVDGRRKLVLIRRDNLEHLVLIGGAVRRPHRAKHRGGSSSTRGATTASGAHRRHAAARRASMQRKHVAAANGGLPQSM